MQQVYKEHNLFASRKSSSRSCTIHKLMASLGRLSYCDVRPCHFQMTKFVDFVNPSTNAIYTCFIKLSWLGHRKVKENES